MKSKMTCSSLMVRVLFAHNHQIEILVGIPAFGTNICPGSRCCPDDCWGEGLLRNVSPVPDVHSKSRIGEVIAEPIE
jgi:hypothetical protein